MTYEQIKQELKKAADLIDAGSVGEAHERILALDGVTKNDIDHILSPEQIRALMRHALALAPDVAEMAKVEVTR